MPSGRKIVFAGLYWSANRYTTDGWTGPLDTVELKAPGSKGSVAVTGTLLTAAVDDSSRVYYESFADVTDLITKQGKVQVSGVATATTRNDEDPTYYGGWALVVVYEAPGTHQDVSVYDGGAWIARDSSTTFDFAAGGESAQVGVVAWDGDRGTDRRHPGAERHRRWCRCATTAAPARPRTPSTPPRWARAGRTRSASTPSRSTWAELGEGVQRLTASTVGDQYLIGAVTVTTPRAELRPGRPPPARP